ncbi:MAG: hypothetical protein AAGA48_27505 [Myxococcota bacterium]
MTLLPALSLWFAVPDAEAADVPTAQLAPGDRKSFGRPHAKGANRPRRKARKKRDPYRGPFKKSKYPFQEILRPLVLPKNQGEIGVGLTYARPDGQDFLGAGISFNYGIGEVFEFGVGTDFGFIPDVLWSEVIGLNARVLVSDGRRLDWAPGIAVGIPTNGGPGLLVVDLTARTLFSKRVFLLFGQRAIPITLGQNASASLVGNVGLGVQVSKKTVLSADTTVVTLQVAPSIDSPVTGIWDFLTLTGQLQVTPARQVDVGIRGNVIHAWSGGGSPEASGTIFGAFRF